MKRVVRPRAPRYDGPAAMPIAANNAIRFASGLVVLGAAAACGSQGVAGPFEGELGAPDFGFVGSGGGGHGYPRDAGSHVGDGGTHDGGLDGASPDGSRGVEDAAASSSSGGPGDDGSALDGNPSDGGSEVSVTFDLPANLFDSLDWVISGPSGYYSGTVHFGEAHSLEFVAGGIQAGSGYTLTLAGDDRFGDACSGTSAPFEVFPGEVSGASVVITCSIPLDGATAPANVTTGAVGVEAGVVFHDM